MSWRATHQARLLLAAAIVLTSTAAVTSGATPAGAAGTKLPADGTFVSNSGVVYHVVGRALTRVFSWAPFGGPHRSVPISDRQVLAAADVVTSGTFIRTVPDKRIYRVVGGAPIYVSSWQPFGGVRKTLDVDARGLGNPPFTPFMADGTFVRTPGDGRIYVTANGAPVYVHSWAAFGGVRKSVDIDPAAIRRRGTGAYSYVRAAPPDNTWLDAVTVPGKPVYTYVVVGGAPVFLPRTDHLPEGEAEKFVDARAVDAAGGAFPDNVLRARPADGTFFYALESFDVQQLQGKGQYYWVHDGAAIPVKDAKNCPAVPHALIDIEAVQRAGTGGVWNHLAKPPANPPTPPC